MSEEKPPGFEGLNYPGKKKPVNRGPKKPESEDAGWDAKPSYYVVFGRKQEFFTIGDLAAALGYSVQSIRAWEAARLLPPTPYRSPKTKAPVAAGRSSKGRRLWTREQINAILAAARKHDVILNREPPTEAFAHDVRLAFDRISEEDRETASA